MYGPYMLRTAVPVLKSHILTLLSHPPDKRILSSSLSNLRANTLFTWPGSPVPPPSRVNCNFLVCSSYTLGIQSLPPVANLVPSGLQSTVRSQFNSSKIVCRSLPLVVCQCCKLPLALTEINTFLVTPGAARGLHLKIFIYKMVPDTGDRHRFLHIVVEDVTLLSCEGVENLD